MAFKGPLLKPSEKATANGVGTKRNGHSRSLRQVSRYEVLKDKIKTWCEDRFKIGEALAEIQRDKLYKDEYPTFEECCESEFGLKRSHAYQLMSAVEVKATIEMSAMADKITNERQARALAPVPVEKRVEVLESVVEQGPVTAKAITETAARVLRPVPDPALPKPKAKPEPEMHYDKTGYTIPDSIWDDWQRAESFGAELREISRIKVVVEKALEEKDIIFAEITSTTLAAIKNMRSDLKRVIPHAVCTSCQGRNPKKCTLCKGRGFVSQFTYDTCIPMSTKQIREKAAKK